MHIAPFVVLGEAEAHQDVDCHRWGGVASVLLVVETQTGSQEEMNCCRWKSVNAKISWLHTQSLHLDVVPS